MSYDFVLFRPRDGVDPHEIAQAEVDEIERGKRDPKVEARKRAIADALTACDAQLDAPTPDFDQISKLYKMPVEEVYEKFRHIEINDMGVSGFQILLFDDRASVSVPHWHKGDAVRATFERLWALIEIICREGGFEVFDPQLDRVINVHSFDDVVRGYASVTARMDDRLGHTPRKPWWKFW